MKLKKNQIVITALVAMIGAAGYLNYIDTHPQVSEVMLTDESDLAMVWDGDTASAVDENADIAVEDTAEAETGTTGDGQSAANTENAGEAVFVNSSMDTGYFVQAKLDREQARAREKDMLNSMLSNDSMDPEGKNNAANAMLEIQKRIERETAAEAMIEAKGFKEVYVRIDDDTVDVVVDRSELTDAEVAQIEDIVKRKTGMASDKIRISPLKK
ncbi:MAG: SpoIIIAH-like family protein [Firmicutes bacterium]|nr:SpoIIIAH-like family protein [Bacillota bacterium]